MRTWSLLGVDPGKDGAVALLQMEHQRSLPRLLSVVSTDALVVIGEMVERADVIVFERQQASAQMGRGSAFALGRAAGMVEGVVLVGAKVPISWVTPVTWRTAFGLGGGTGGKPVGHALALALLETAAERELVSRHDEADAVLLAWWGWRHIALKGANGC
jgi:hypothetical protein